MLLKDVELKLISELLKNSRRSDRELAKVIGVSQPTVSRLIQRLEKQGLIREYTMIPDYVRLGFQIVSITFAKLSEPASKEIFEDILRHSRELEEKNPSPTIIAMNGMGCGADNVAIALHKDYSEYVRFKEYIKTFPHLKVDDIKSFIIDLNDKSHWRYLTFSALAEYLLKMNETR
jgi:DNA-binding Lrp family transcriptional regulator